MKPKLKLERLIFRAWTPPALESPYTRSAWRELARAGVKAAPSEVASCARRAKYLVFGDDRLVPWEQVEIVGLLRSWREEGSIDSLVTDRFEERAQVHLDSFLGGRRTLPALLRRLGLESRGVRYAEGGCGFLLAWAKRRRIRVVACGGAGALDRADERLLHRISSEVRAGRRPLVWTGALRLSPRKLPNRLKELPWEGLALSMNAPPCRWASGSTTDYRRIGSLFLSVSTSPLTALAVREIWYRRSGALVAPEELRSYFSTVTRSIARELSYSLPSLFPRVVTPFDGSLQRPLCSGAFAPRTTRFLRDRVLRGESAYLPGERMVLLSSLSPGEIAEEAAHFLRLAGRQRIPDGPHTIAVEEALAFFGSRLVDPERSVPPAQAEDHSEWARLHRRAYRVGARLHHAWQSRKKRRRIVGLWRLKPEDGKGMRDLWNELQAVG